MGVSHAVTMESIELHGIPSFSYGLDDDDYNIKGVEGNTYLEQKVELMHQLGYSYVTEETFAGCTTITQIDNRARTIMGI